MQAELFPAPNPHLERVSSRIGRCIQEYFTKGGYFHAEQLREYVLRNVGTVAPGSSDRIMRELRLKGLINYRVTNRLKSEYQILEVKQ